MKNIIVGDRFTLSSRFALFFILYYFLNRPESMMRGDLKRGLTKFTAESARG
jgi:hypothetical protein